MEALLELPEEQLRDLRLLDERFPDVRIELGMARAEVAARASIRAYADQLVAIDSTLREAREFPEVFVGIDQAELPDAVEFAERAAIADIAMRLALSEQTIRGQAHESAVLMERAPRLWLAFRDGEVSIANARAVAELMVTMPVETCAAFEDAVLDAAGRLAPARFRARARVVRERLHAEALAERHRRSAEDRRVHFEADLDGMAWLHLYLPADSARRAMARLDHVAKSLATAPDETRTLSQLRADAAADAIAGVLGTACSVGVEVAVTVPVMTLLGESQEPGILEGYGPIDAETARRLSVHAPSFHRILTHPVSGVILDYDRTTYRVPADLKRRVQVRDVICTFIGCGRLAADCDLDHTRAWEHDGKTADTNLAALCRNHHRLKHRSKWQMSQDPATGISWTSPTGVTLGADPPPF